MEKSTCSNKYIFGPVPSRRLGLSLGIDLVPFKTCSFDCIYCQLGRTTHKTLARTEYVPLVGIVDELKAKLDEGIQFDCLTLSGSGEPTLYSRLEELIASIKALTEKPVVVLTNSSLLWDKEVRVGIREADVVVPSLDAGNESLFQFVNRPCSGLSLGKVVDGIAAFAAEYSKEIWLEIFLLNGVTSIESEVIQINTLIKTIKPSRIQLNTVKRPPAESYALPVPQERMLSLAQFLEGNVEIIAEFHRPSGDSHSNEARSGIAGLLKRRPCTLDDLAGGLQLHKNEVLKYLEEMHDASEVTSSRHGGSLYYKSKVT